MSAAKLGTVSALTYLLFLIANITQLEVIGRYKITTSCVLTLSNCQPNFLIGDETQYLSKDEFALINSILRKSNLEISNGDLQTIQEKVITPIENMTDLVADKAGESTFEPTAALLTSKNDDGDEIILNGKEMIYKIETPTDTSNQKAGLADAGRDPEKKMTVKATGRHLGLPQLVRRPHWANRRASAGTQAPRLLAATTGEDIV